MKNITMQHTKNKLYSAVSAGLVLGAMLLVPMTSAFAVTSTVQVHTMTLLDGSEPTTASVNNYLFPMTETIQASNLNGGTQFTNSFNLGTGTDPNAYEATSASMAAGASYSVEAVSGGSTQVLPVGASCVSGMYSLQGYKTSSVSFDDALSNGTYWGAAPTFDNLSSDMYVVAINNTCPQTTNTSVKVHVMKYLDGSEATATSAQGTIFPINATWTAANLNNGQQTSGSFSLGNGTDQNHLYQYDSDAMDSGSSYSVSENTSASSQFLPAGSTCEAGKYVLDGYATSMVSFADAAASNSLSTTTPTYSNLGSDAYVIIYNTTCPTQGNSTARVHVMKYLDGSEATATSANNYLFPMSATWTAGNLNGGQQTNGTFSLGNGTDQNHLYQFDSAAMDMGSSYTTSEVTDNTSQVLPVGTACVAGKYSLQGYKTSPISFADAMSNGTYSSEGPMLDNLSGDMYVVVMNNTCPQDTNNGSNGSGTIDGTVTGGTSADGTLAVNSVTTVRSTAVADGTFANGWKYVFNVTVPDNETNLAMKFANWTNTSFPSFHLGVANNMRISSQQADNNGATVLLNAADTYSSPSLHITGDLDANVPGKQVQIVIEVAVPSTTVNGTYSTTYGIQTL